MKKMKLTRKTVASVCAAAMALTLAVPSTVYMKNQAVKAEAAETDGLLGTAVRTINFNDGFEEDMKVESEQRLAFDENGSPVIKEVSGEYVYAKEDATDQMPEVVEDSTRGKVLEFKDYVKVDRYEKTSADAVAAASAEGVSDVSSSALNQEYPTGSLIQQKERLSGRVKMENPFKEYNKKNEGKELSGITISYWVKVPKIKVNDVGEKVTDGTGKDRGANATTVVFNNTGRLVMNKDDGSRYRACKAYDEALANGDTETLKDYDLGEQQIVADERNNVYVLYKNFGKLVRLNPNYPAKEASDQAADVAKAINGTALGGGWYDPIDVEGLESERKIEVYAVDMDTMTVDKSKVVAKISSFANKGSTNPDENTYERFRYRYAAEDDFENDFSSKSKIREGIVKGSLQISTDNDFGFRADNYRTESYTVNGVNQQKAVDGVRVKNPNSEDDGQFGTFDSYNQFYFDGDELVTNLRNNNPAAEKWHYVTIVIKNDWVQTYVDGFETEAEIDYTYMKEEPGVTDHTFGQKNVGKTFNKGKGIKKPFAFSEDNIPDWSPSGTLNPGPANAYGDTLMDWLQDVNTDLYLGGTGFASECLGQGYGSIEGVRLDNISFFDYAMTASQAIDLYDEALNDKEENPGGDDKPVIGNVNGDAFVNAKDAVQILRYASKLSSSLDLMIEEERMQRGNVNGDKFVNAKDAVQILRYASKLSSDLDKVYPK